MRRLSIAALSLGLLSGSPVDAASLHQVKQVLRRDALRARATLAVMAGQAVGYAEMAGLRIRVRPYQERVSSKLWRGSRVDEAGLADLKRRGFVAVVGLTAERDLDANARRLGLAHKRISILDNGTPSMAQVKEFLDYVRAQHGPVYVHCEAGVGRTGIMVAAYRIAVEGWDVGRALVEARQHGLQLRNQVELIRQLAPLQGTMTQS